VNHPLEILASLVKAERNEGRTSQASCHFGLLYYESPAARSGDVGVSTDPDCRIPGDAARPAALRLEIPAYNGTHASQKPPVCSERTERVGVNPEPSELVLTKLHRPPLPPDLIPRERLLARLGEPSGRPLTLVSAPAGYGKSTLVSSWLEGLDLPSVWISLDEHDNNLLVFLSYFVKAVESLFDDRMPRTRSILESPVEAPPRALLACLTNELDSLDRRFILVLDDLQSIHDLDIINLLNNLLAHPPGKLHLVLCTRMDPPISLNNLRGRGQVVEIRGRDLQFARDESSRLVSMMLGVSLEAQAEEELDRRYEGWVVGLRLAALALRHQVAEGRVLEGVPSENRLVVDYLMAEILRKQADSLTDWLLKTSILERMNAELCETLCRENGEREGVPQAAREDFLPHGEAFIEWLRSGNLFVTSLDDEGRWYRYHPLFQEFLQTELVARVDDEGMRELHARAGRWLAEAGHVEDALRHLLAGGETDAAIELFTSQRIALLNGARWRQLRGYLDLFPAEVRENAPELLIAEMWLTYQRGDYGKLASDLAYLEDVLRGADLGATTLGHLQGEISCARALLAVITNDAKTGLKAATDSVESTAPEFWIVRALARLCLAEAYQMEGDLGRAHAAIYDGFRQEQETGPLFRATLLVTLCNILWIAADLSGLERAARQSIGHSREARSRQMLAWGEYNLGRVAYERNDLASAQAHFCEVTDSPFGAYGECYAESACGLALTYQAQGRAVDAARVLDTAESYFVETNNATQVERIEAFRAKLMVMQGKVRVARKWADRHAVMPPLRPEWGIFSAHLTLARLRLAEEGTLPGRGAGPLLADLHAHFERTHNTRYLIETLLLEARLHRQEGSVREARAALERALRMAEPGGFVRTFIDEGPQIRELLRASPPGVSRSSYLRDLLASFPVRPAPFPGLVEPLTPRELEILLLLCRRMSNREISETLVISEGTVKQHLHNLYEKLGVNNRRGAAEKAAELGIEAAP
jgi:LuxR family maltose regulon positive regulatory protein